ncbi:hypothetical protein LWI29_003453 [Acer saccharum]|uniref:Uncharacterized protein n=1 Tax=Acer saccharum TaxID=4024 RepID=A0AA39VMA4_ACESA|nr:hypothetical protein LWI29_003453 [Acer saccharum]
MGLVGAGDKTLVRDSLVRVWLVEWSADSVACGGSVWGAIGTTRSGVANVLCGNGVFWQWRAVAVVQSWSGVVPFDSSRRVGHGRVDTVEGTASPTGGRSG